MSFRAIAVAADGHIKLWVLVGFAVLGYAGVFTLGFTLLYRILEQVNGKDIQTTTGWALAAALTLAGLLLGKPLVEVAASLKSPQDDL